MSTVKGLCPGRFKNGRPCVVRPRFGKVCSYHRKFGRHSRAVASARDEVVRQAKYEVERGSASPALRAAVAALARLEAK